MPTIVHVVHIYALTYTVISDNDVETFYGNLEDVLRVIPNREITIWIGDFYSKIGNTELVNRVRQKIEIFGVGERNTREELLIQFC